MVSSMLIGPLSDAHGRKNIIALGCVLVGFAAPLVALSPTLPLLVITLALFGATYAILMTPTLPEMAEFVDKKGGGAYATVYGMWNVAYSAGMIVGPVVGGMVMDATGEFLPVM
ncbi:hypothetical protein HK102_007183, partial [Quaeritorhiza haematococci]